MFDDHIKCIEINCHFMHDQLTNNSINIHHIYTEHQLTNLFTKVLSVEQFQHLKDKLGICNLHALT